MAFLWEGLASMVGSTDKPTGSATCYYKKNNQEMMIMKDLVTERLKLKDLYPERAKEIAKEYGIKADDLELVRKGIVAEKAEVDKDERSVTSYINTAAKDRDNEVIEPKGVVLTHYRKNPIVPWAHDYRSLPVGKNIWIKKDDKGLLAKTVFLKHAFAEDVYRLYTEDVAGTGPAMKAWSIGFVPLKWETPELEEKGRKVDEADTRIKRTYKKWELLEYSPVPVPSNPEALTEMVAKGLIKSDKLKEEIIECIGDECAITVTKPEETDDFIRIPVRDCAVTATITISEKQGITALYCGKIKKIRTYIFNKKAPYDWTMKKAQAWVKEHGKEVDDFISKWKGLTQTEKMDDVAYAALGEQIGFMLEPGEVIELDDEKDEDPKTTVKRPDLQGNPSVWDIIEAIEGQINIGVAPRRNWVCDLYPVKYPSGSCVISIRDKETKYVLYPYTYDDGEISFGEATELEQTYKPKRTEREQQITEELFDRTTEQLNKIEEELKSLKEGRVLSAKNRKLIQDALAGMEAAVPPLKNLLVATEPPQREEFELEVDNSDKKLEDNTVEIDINDGKIPSYEPGRKLELGLDDLTKKITSILKDKLNKARGKVE